MKRSLKIRSRAILVIISTNFTIILLSILAGTGYVREHIEKYIEADMMVVAGIADQFISSELDLLRYEAGAAAESLSAAGMAGWDGILAERTRQYPKFIGMAVMGEDAGIAASAGRKPASSDLFGNASVQKAFRGDAAFTSTIPTDGGVVFYLAVPVPHTTGHILILTLDGMYFTDLASGYHVWETGHIFIDDSEGYVIANVRREWVQSRRNFVVQARSDEQYAPVAAVIKKLTAGESGIDYYAIGGIPRICAYMPISGSREGWCLGIVAPLSESPVRNVDRGLLLIAAIGFLLNIAAAVVASDFIRKPYEEVAALKERAEAGLREQKKMMTELEQQDHLLERALTDAEKANSAKSSFLAHMSHEIRTPLNAVIGLSELSLAEDRLSRTAEENLEKIYGAGATILSIVNDILDISKIESGKLELYPVEYDTPSLVNDVVMLNVVRIGEKPVTFKLSLDERLPGSLFGDDLRVKQIFNNLLSNAFKYTNAGTVEWKVSFEREGDHVWMISSVRDTGIGMRPESVRDLFTDYNQVDTKANRNVEGTGLGLAITKRLAEMMDGVITVESEYGKGSAFHVRLRQGRVSDTPVGKSVADSLMDLRYAMSKRDRNTALARTDLSYAAVLVVDDIATNLDVVKGMLKPYGLNVDCVLSGPRAIERIRAGQPRYSAIFMDHMMPGMDGIETTRRIREEIGTDYARNIPIIALTANAIAGSEKMFLRHGFQAFISKPIDMVKLDSVLRQWVRDKGLAKEDSATGEKTSAALHGTLIDGLDMRKALERFGGSEAVLMDVLRSYTAHTPALLNSLREYLASENFEDYAIVVHGIKGSSYGIFAQEVGRAAEALELASKADDYDAVKRGHPAFEEMAGALLRNIGRALAGLDAVTDKPAAAAPDPALLSELREACEMFDMDRVDRAMERLESFLYKDGGNLVAWLREQVDNMDFEKIAGAGWPAGGM